jgi:hypothetical protein
MQDPELVNQLKERLPEALFEKLDGSLSIDRDRLKFAEYKIRVLEERLRLVRIEKYGPGSEKLSDAQLELLELEPGVSSAEVQAESERAQLKLPLKRAAKNYRFREPHVSCSLSILIRFFGERGIVAEGESPRPSPMELELAHFARYLCEVRGLVISTSPCTRAGSDVFWSSLDLIKILTVCDDCRSTILRPSSNVVRKQTIDIVCSMSWPRFGLFSSENTPWGFSHEHCICR